MMRIIGTAAILVMLAMMGMVGNGFASDCSNAMVEALSEEGLTREQINRVCLKAAMKEEGLTDEQIDRIITKTESMPAVSSTAAPIPAPDPVTQKADTPVVAPAEAPLAKNEISPEFPPDKINTDLVGECVGGILGWCFEKGEYREIEVLETKIDGNRAKVIFHVQTIKDHSGKLIAEYRKVAGKWEMKDVESIDFD